MKCLDCHFLTHNVKGSPDQQMLDHEKRSWLVRNLDSLLDVIDIKCARDLRNFPNGDARGVFYLLELKNKCTGYRKLDLSLTVEQMLNRETARQHVRWPLWYKILVIITLILAATAAGTVIWQTVIK